MLSVEPSLTFLVVYSLCWDNACKPITDMGLYVSKTVRVANGNEAAPSTITIILAATPS